MTNTPSPHYMSENIKHKNGAFGKEDTDDKPKKGGLKMHKEPDADNKKGSKKNDHDADNKKKFPMKKKSVPKKGKKK